MKILKRIMVLVGLVSLFLLVNVTFVAAEAADVATDAADVAAEVKFVAADAAVAKNVETWPIGVIARFDDHGTGLPWDKALAIGVSVIQLKVPLAENRTEENAKKILSELKNRGITLTTVVSGFAGESYATIPIVRETVGLVPEHTRRERFEDFKSISDFAKQLGAPAVQFHLGFVPEDTHSQQYSDVVQITRAACDYLLDNGQWLNLETGQETAAALLQFLSDVNRRNLHINFDAANMILYGSGEPIEALQLVGRDVRSVHCKDARWSILPGKQWGVEVLFGTGDVDAELLLKTLRDVGYNGPLIIERENKASPDQQYAEIQHTIEYLKQLKLKILSK